MSRRAATEGGDERMSSRGNAPAIGPTQVTRRLLALLSALVLTAVLLPASASAQDGSGPCTAEVRATQDERVASFVVDCGDASIENVVLETTEAGRVEGDSGTECSNEQRSQTFECRPSGSGDDTLISGRFTNTQGDSVCADPRLTIDFTVDFANGGTQQSAADVEAQGQGTEPDGTQPADDQNIQNVEVSGCERPRGDRGTTPRGGVDSGAGGAAEPRRGLSPAVIAGGASLLALALLGGTVLALRRRASR